LFTNLNVPSNTVLHGYHGITLSPLSVSEQEEIALSVYPNPATDLLTISSSSLLSDESYFITDALGRIVLTGKLGSNQSIISIESLSKGFYLLNFVTSSSSIKFVKQ
jgi:hypothetical protein